ncbi:hypothetical protein DESUT3_30580 [Desulfuromonas versatilis]|uniref:General secretion pathway protein M n=1 Tax=Desulfuromonas versatilis TaxID=2802975 RepID=A0ABM8HVN7_9BACT|nr:type II secretion system protein GspM [Desulfuromonas versatilis]BCR05989.1 hypothetical protein DESUT3_30580 [Desulfuromonas versatilis]
MIGNLSQRERIALVLGALAVLVTLVFFAVVSPYREALDRLDRQIASRQKQVYEVQSLRRQYLSLQQQLNEAERRLARGEAFSLFSFVESLATRVASKENLVYMRPQPTSVKEGFREDSVEIKLDKIRLNQLVQLLYELETTDAVLQVKNLRLKIRFEDRTLLDAVLTVSSFGRSA